MAVISYRRHRFPPIVIQHAVWLYLRFTLSYRDVEELLAERGLDISYESVRSWVLKFGPMSLKRNHRRNHRCVVVERPIRFADGAYVEVVRPSAQRAVQLAYQRCGVLPGR